MSVQVVRLGSARAAGEGLRLGTVRWPPRGVPKAELASRDYYDVWLPTLAPSAETIKLARGSDLAATWKRFERRYRREMSEPDAKVVLQLLAAMSHGTSFSVGCYCVDEAKCHRSILRALLAQAGAKLA